MKPTLTEIYNDNGGLSHEQIIDADTGVVLFSYDPEEQSVIEEKKRMALLQKVVERINNEALQYGTKCCLDKYFCDLILETKLEE